MCRVMSILKINDDNREKVWDFAEVMGELMTPGNDDGLGYAGFDSKGNIFGEKWLINKTAFTNLSARSPKKVNKIYSRFGEKISKNDIQGMILHTRAGTCGISIDNVHPFVDDIDNPNVAIIHNGIIRNESLFTRKHSTCDSEVLAHLYQEEQVSKDIKNVSKLTSALDGWYTVLNLAKDSDGRMVMDAYTNTGMLDLHYVKELGTSVYSTNSATIREACKILGMEFSDFRTLRKDQFARIDVLTGEILYVEKMEKLFEAKVVPFRMSREDIQEWLKNNLANKDTKVDGGEYVGD